LVRRRSTSTEWLQWVEIQKAATRVWLQEDDPTSAIAAITQYLASEPPQVLRCEAIAFRGTICRESDELLHAKSDFLSALELAEEQNHVRFELEDTIGALSVELGDLKEADRWYSAALQTAAANPRVAGGGLLLRFLELRGEQGFTVEEQQIVEKVVKQSWHLLRVEGEPDLDDLAGAARKLLKAQQGPFSAERPLTPKHG
jgi:hypothetical protein